MQSAQVIIVGAGLGGLATAIGLCRAGFEVNVFERSQAIGEIGAGIMLTPNAVRALDALGVLDAVERQAVRPLMSYSRHFLTGEMLGSRPLADALEAEYGKPMLTIHRADLHRVLRRSLQALKPDAIHVGHEFIGLSRHGDRVSAKFANGAEAEGDVLIGADGIRSSVAGVLGVASEPRFTGLVAWRGLVPVERLPERLRSTSMFSWIGEDKHIIEYTVGGLKNYVAMALQPEWRSEGWSTPSTLSEVEATFDGWHEDITEILRATPPDGLFKWALFDRDPLECLVYGSVVLMGDAAHPMLPLMAQGSAMAMEDAAVLTRCFTASDTVATALERFQVARRERTAWTQLQSRTAREYNQSTVAGRWQVETKKRSDVLYSYDAAEAPV